MSKARKCDRCGKFYEPYFCNDQNRFALDVNGIAFAKIYSDGEPRVLNNDSYDLCQKCLDDMHEFFMNPKHGRWEGGQYDGYADDAPVYDSYYCSECGEEIWQDTIPDFRFCPHCGARMDAGEDQSGGGGENATD